MENFIFCAVLSSLSSSILAEMQAYVLLKLLLKRQKEQIYLDYVSKFVTTYM